MNSIIFKESLAPNIKKMVVQAPTIAQKALPGQFVVIIADEKGERLPLTIVDSDPDRGTLTLIFQELGKSTYRLGELKANDKIFALLGPLGKATKIKKVATAVITVGGGVGIAEVYPVTRAFKQAGNSVISIIGARNKNLLILEEPLRRVSDKLLITTDDGSYGDKGLVSDALRKILTETKVGLVYAVGPVAMMRAVCELTRPDGIETMVSLNPIMLDATGMCGTCRVSVGERTEFACVHGPEFNGHLVDFDELQKRLDLFSEQEKQSLENFKEMGRG